MQPLIFETSGGKFGVIGTQAAPYKHPTATLRERMRARATLEGRDFIPTAILWQSREVPLDFWTGHLLRAGLGVLVAGTLTPLIVMAIRRHERRALSR